MTEPIAVEPVIPEPAAGLATAVVVGIGDPQRRDDGVGPAVVDLLAGRDLDAMLVSSDGGTSALVDILRDRNLAFLVDAVRAQPSHPGRVHRLVVMRPGYTQVCAGSHGTTVSRAMDLVRKSGRQPLRMVVFAIESADTGPGRGLSAPVAAAARRVADQIAAEIPTRSVAVRT